MDLPPCPACGEEMELESPRGPARCKSCGLKVPVVLDTEALGNLLEDASERALGPRPRLAPAKEFEGPVLVSPVPSALLSSGVPQDVPAFAAPRPPKELVDRTPPPLEDPRTTISSEVGGDDGPSVPVADEERRRREKLRPRGELFR